MWWSYVICIELFYFKINSTVDDSIEILAHIIEYCKILVFILHYVCFPLQLKNVSCLIQDNVSPHCDKRMAPHRTRHPLPDYLFIVLKCEEKDFNVHSFIFDRSFDRLMYHKLTVIFTNPLT